VYFVFNIAATNKKKKKKKKKKYQTKIAIAERERDLGRVADLKYGALPDLEKQISVLEIKEAEESQNRDDDQTRLVTEIVGPEQIAEIVSRWTGIPVVKLSQSERDKLLHLSDQLHKRVVGQNEAVDAVAEAVLRSRAGLSRPQQPTGSFLYVCFSPLIVVFFFLKKKKNFNQKDSSAPLVSARQNWPRRWPLSSLTTRTRWCDWT